MSNKLTFAVNAAKPTAFIEMSITNNTLKYERPISTFIKVIPTEIFHISNIFEKNCSKMSRKLIFAYNAAKLTAFIQVSITNNTLKYKRPISMFTNVIPTRVPHF